MRISLEDTDNDEQGVIFYDDQPFTGTVVESLPDGKVIGEVDYYNGLQNGPERTYRLNGELKAEAIYRHGMPIEIREWHSNGKLARLTRIEQGRRVEEHVWDENGIESER